MIKIWLKQNLRNVLFLSNIRKFLSINKDFYRELNLHLEKSSTKNNEIAKNLIQKFNNLHTELNTKNEQDLLNLFELIHTEISTQNSQQVLENYTNLLKKNYKILTIPSIITILQSLRFSNLTHIELFGFLVRYLLINLENMNIDEITQTTLAYFYCKNIDPNMTRKLENLLIENISKIEPSDFCVLLDEMAYNNIKMTEFLDIGQDYIYKKHTEIPCLGYAGILNAYIQFMPVDSIKTVKILESDILANLEKFTVSQIVNFVELFSRKGSGTNELFNELEKFIIANIKSVKNNEISILLEAYGNRGKDKLFVLFKPKIMKEYENFNLSELAKIIESYTKIDTKEADLYDILESKFIKSKTKLSKNSLLSILYGYTNQNISGKFKIYDHLEEIITKYFSRFSASQLVKIAYYYTLAQKGKHTGFNKKLILKITEKISEIDVRASIQLLAITVREKMNKDFCGLVNTQLFRYFEKFNDDELREIIFLSNIYPQEYEDILKLCKEKLEKGLENIIEEKTQNSNN